MQKIWVKFDEYCKSAMKSFFEAFGFKVESEFEIFKLPKKVDILIVKLKNKKVPREFDILKFFQEHNLISYKSPRDRIKSGDFNDAIIYLHGYINMISEAHFENCTMTILCNHTPKKYLSDNKQMIIEMNSGHWQINYGTFKIHLINLNLLEITAIDNAFLSDFAETVAFKKSLNYQQNAKLPKKIIDIIKYYLYVRVSNFENDDFKEVKMPVAMKADMTEMIMPFYNKGKQEGKQEGKLEGERERTLKIAKEMKIEGIKIDVISKITGLAEKEIREL